MISVKVLKSRRYVLILDKMGILAKDIAKYICEKKETSLGDTLYKRFITTHIDSVEEVRKIRERN